MDHPSPGQAAASGLQARLSRGTNQAGVRLYNERLALSLIRRGGGLPKAEIARLTGLSPQTTTIIINRLEAEGLLLRSEPQRGRVGQPAVPYRLNPEGAFAFGLKIGRRSTDLVLVDFLGTVRERARITHAYPTPEGMLTLLRTGLSDILTRLGPEARTRIAGLGIATPFELWNWQSEIGGPPESMTAWRDFDILSAVHALSPWPVSLCNDGTAACAAEHFFGANGDVSDFLYVFIGSFVGGGIVLGGKVMQGRTGNAGAIGSMPIPSLPRAEAHTQQMIHHASLVVLERALAAEGLPTAELWQVPVHWPAYGAPLADWIERTGRAIALLAAAAASIIDFEAVVIDGAVPSEVRDRLVGRARATFDTLDRQGLSPLAIRAGSVGPDARAIGGAALPLIGLFGRDSDVLFKEQLAG